MYTHMTHVEWRSLACMGLSRYEVSNTGYLRNAVTKTMKKLIL